jgi:hypothetical protein
MLYFRNTDNKLRYCDETKFFILLDETTFYNEYDNNNWQLTCAPLQKFWYCDCISRDQGLEPSYIRCILR